MFALFSGLLGTAFSVLIRMELSGPGVQYIADNQLYNSIITAHALLMIFFMVEKNLFILNIKSPGFAGSSLDIGIVNNSDNNDVLITGNNNNNNDDNQNSQKPKHKYVKVLVNDPFNNRDIIHPVLKLVMTNSVGFTSVDFSPKHNNYFSLGHNNTHRLYSTTARRLNMDVGSSSSTLHPYFVTGFIDGEGCFSISITSHNKTITG